MDVPLVWIVEFSKNYNLGQNKMEQQTSTPPPYKSRMKPSEGQKPTIFPSLILGQREGSGLPFIFSKIIVYTLASSTDNCYFNCYTDREESENEKRRKNGTRSLPILHSFPKTEQ